MAETDLPILYVKEGCPWCQRAKQFLDKHQVAYREREVTQNSAYREELEQVSGQTKTPTFNLQGDLLCDFDYQELGPFLRDHGVPLRAT